MKGKLYIVATPIGNLSDITLRAIETLKSVDVIACEDTRHTLRLLNHLGIKKPLTSYHKFSKSVKTDSIIEYLLNDRNIALVSDAGTPAISDPGQLLVKRAIEAGVEVVAIPGASAVIAGLSASGLDTNEFVFIGFLPHKKGRQTKIKEIATEKRTVVLYESPYRIKKLLVELEEACGDREIVVAREMTKLFETIYRGKISEIKGLIKEKGEFVVIIKGTNGKK
jgi:16S rRNA (cytidine1402-2'-O)-methyltransferase